MQPEFPLVNRPQLTTVDDRDVDDDLDREQLLSSDGQRPPADESHESGLSTTSLEAATDGPDRDGIAREPSLGSLEKAYLRAVE